MIVNDRKTTNFTTREYFGSKRSTTEAFASSRDAPASPKMHILPLRAVFSSFLPLINSSDILWTSVISSTERFGSGKSDCGSSRAAQTPISSSPLDVKSARWLLTLRTA
ncbi:hypothetical protein QQF64_010518 [Cirrhinus molitorella]|uniref:Uncharacterized protein n=1 Tax=Cirrhinus molitorella TaxID=172907 RepID=A0ABR3M478_9TELE